MGSHDIFIADSRAWISATDSLQGLGHWFSEGGMIEPLDRGYELQQFGVHRYCYFQFVTYGLQVFYQEDVIFQRTIDPTLPPQQFTRAA
ncbi:hypothetical protein [Agrobacterium tumefaciens]|uniref:hypothetical protein n=1 Tax=Agrobacterium tumefaciens TaxID=358 RepID=UPI0015743C3A|nr:hypothetical protein [Agrobacterium tumefaciens]WCJ65206.1 hypothetical protein G6M15_20410 [Agrobacterium tumefaciens]